MLFKLDVDEFILIVDILEKNKIHFITFGGDFIINEEINHAPLAFYLKLSLVYLSSKFLISSSPVSS